MSKLTPLSDPDNIMVVWDDDEPAAEPETSASRRKRLRPAAKPLKRRSA